MELIATHREDAVASSDLPRLGDRLDKDHLPETNGRMAICRRCGATTDSPRGHHHVPRDSQLARVGRWLDQQAHLTRIERARAQMS